MMHSFFSVIRNWSPEGVIILESNKTCNKLSLYASSAAIIYRSHLTFYFFSWLW